MRRTILAALLTFTGGLTSILVAQTEAPPANDVFAQKLADEFTAKYVRLISIGIHGKPPNSSEYQIIAHTLRKKVGDKSTPEDTEVMRSGKPDGPNSVGGGIFDVAIQLFDSSQKTIGVIAMHIKPGPGDPKAEPLKMAYEIRDELSKQIPSDTKLFEKTN
jgi:iron complex outermembrane receptor protein